MFTTKFDSWRSFPRGRNGRLASAFALIVFLSVAVSGCLTQTYQRGYLRDPAAIAQVAKDDSKGEVEILLGSPSTTGTVDGGAAYYYISQDEKRVSFLPAEKTNHRVLAVYFNEEDRVQRVADYGLNDGKLFDFVSETTPTSGEDLGVVQQFIYRLINPVEGN